MSEEERLQEIASELRRLVASSPLVEAEVDQWSQGASQTYKRLLDSYPDLQLPIQVMHYVHDADIRARDADYRESQTRTMETIITELEHGVVPPSRGVTISIGIRGLLLAICAVFLLILLAVRACA